MPARLTHAETGRHTSPAASAPAGERGQLIVVSNRLPLTVSTKRDAVVVRHSVGGLATGLRDPHERLGGTWVGWPGRVDQLPPEARDEVARRLEAEHLIPVTLTEREVHEFYEGIANGVLWPICHDRLDRLPLRVTGWDVYEQVNERFAAAAAACHRPGDRIWIHDYHLLRTPALVRRRLPHARIGFFLHVPFPNPEIFFALPTRRWLIEGMLGADVIGFHTRRYRGHFTAALRRLYGTEMDADGTIAWEGRRVQLGIFPMGVDAAGLAERAASRRVNGTVLELRASQQRLLVGIDRLDYTKGIPRRLLALERLLIEHPEWRGRVRLVQVAVPSRAGVQAYRQVRREVNRLVGRINGEFGTPSWTPVHYVYRSVPQAMLLALYRSADVMLVTPVRDGMNLVAKEFAASRTDEEGVLVLSELAGAADELTDALLVNPYDVDQMAAAMHQALTMEGRERRDRMRALRTVVRDNDVHRWTASFLEALDAAG